MISVGSIIKRQGRVNLKTSCAKVVGEDDVNWKVNFWWQVDGFDSYPSDVRNILKTEAVLVTEDEFQNYRVQ